MKSRRRFKRFNDATRFWRWWVRRVCQDALSRLDRWRRGPASSNPLFDFTEVDEEGKRTDGWELVECWTLYPFVYHFYVMELHPLIRNDGISFRGGYIYQVVRLEERSGYLPKDMKYGDIVMQGSVFSIPVGDPDPPPYVRSMALQAAIESDIRIYRNRVIRWRLIALVILLGTTIARCTGYL